MLELPTIKTDFLFENSQDFDQTTHARPQHPIVFIDIISLYFNSIGSVKYVFQKVTSWSHHAFFHGTTQARGRKSAYAHFGMQTILLFSLFMFKMAVYEGDSECSNEFTSISYVISLATSFKILSNSFDTSLRQNLL